MNLTVRITHADKTTTELPIAEALRLHPLEDDDGEGTQAIALQAGDRVQLLTGVRLELVLHAGRSNAERNAEDNSGRLPRHRHSYVDGDVCVCDKLKGSL